MLMSQLDEHEGYKIWDVAILGSNGTSALMAMQQAMCCACLLTISSMQRIRSGQGHHNHIYLVPV